jgi:hypothetical protein
MGKPNVCACPECLMLNLSPLLAPRDRPFFVTKTIVSFHNGFE